MRISTTLLRFAADTFDRQVQKDTTIRVAVFDELRTKESDRGFLGLVAFTAKDRINLEKDDDSKDPIPCRIAVTDMDRGLRVQVDQSAQAGVV